MNTRTSSGKTLLFNINMIGIVVNGIYILSSTKKTNISQLIFVYDNNFEWEISKFVYDNILNVLIIYQYLFKIHILELGKKNNCEEYLVSWNLTG